MRVRARVYTTLRGPVRTAVRERQHRHRWPAPPGTASGPPDFVGIGVQRCGTSWWHALIESHPKVADLGWGAKELHFFDDRWARPDREELREDYAAHFRRRAGQLAGEWTPRYLFDPWSVPLLAQAAPQAKLLVMLRDPVARFVSGLGHARKHGSALDADEVSGTFARGLYADQVARTLAVVPREQVLVLQLEQCQVEPQRHLDRTFEFLGLDPVRVDASVGRNAAVRSVDPPEALVEAVREAYRVDVRRLAELLPGDIDTALWPGVGVSP